MITTVDPAIVRLPQAVWRVCLSHRPYTSAAEAGMKLARIPRRWPESGERVPFTVRPCGLCGWWHIQAGGPAVLSGEVLARARALVELTRNINPNGMVTG